MCVHMHNLTEARYREIDAAFHRGDQPIATEGNAALDRFCGPLMSQAAHTGELPHVLRFPRPANDVEAWAQVSLIYYTREHIRRPILIDYYDEPRHLLERLAEPRPIPSPQQRRASVNARAAWREAKRQITPRRKLRLVKG